MHLRHILYFCQKDSDKMKHIIFLFLFTPVVAFGQIPEKKPYRIASAILPAAFGMSAGVCPDTKSGKFVQSGCLYGAAISISFGRKKPVSHYFINAGVSAVGFLAGRGLREIANK